MGSTFILMELAIVTLRLPSDYYFDVDHKWSLYLLTLTEVTVTVSYMSNIEYRFSDMRDISQAVQSIVAYNLRRAASR